MAQAWSTVEQSPEYQQMAQPDQMAAKQQYFKEVVSQKPEFQSLPDNEKDIAANQFMGTQTEENKPDPWMSNPISQAVKGFAETAHKIPGVRQFMDLNPELQDMENEVPEPKGVLQTVGRMVGGAAGYVPAMMTGSLPMAASAVGLQDAAGDLQEGKGVLESAGKGALSAGATFLGGKAIEGAAGLAGDAFNAVTKSIPKQITDTIGDLYNKAVKPTIVKGNSNMLAKANENVETGVRSIIGNKDNLNLGEEGAKLPKNLQHTSEALDQTTDDVFNKFNEMQKKATGKGVTINGQGLAQSLQPILDDKALKIVSPQTQEYAKKLFERLQNAGDMTPEEAQNMIKGFNGRLKAYYQNPSPDQYGNTAVDALVANNARKVLDDAITSATGEGYQALKNEYGALSSMKKDVSRAAQRNSNLQNKGLLDFSDIMTGEQLVRGILNGNPVEIATGVVGRGIKEFYKRLNSPDANIEKMFIKVSDLMEKEGQPGLADKVSSAVQNAKEKLGGLADMIPGRQPAMGMAGRAGNSPNYGFVQPKPVDNIGSIGELSAEPAVSKQPPQGNPNDIGGESERMVGEGAPATEYVQGKEGSISRNNLRQQNNKPQVNSKDEFNEYQSRLNQELDAWKNEKSNNPSKRLNANKNIVRIQNLIKASKKGS